MFRCLVTSIILGVFVQVLSQGGKEYRFDYEFSTQAGGWLKFHVIPGTWREARLRCYAEGAVLASPLNSRLKAAVISHVIKYKGASPTMIFTGVHARFSKGDYSSIEGVPLLRLSINWAPGEPDNYNNAESCLAMVADSRGSISDVRCEDVYPYVCYKEDTHLTMTECGTTDSAYILEPRTGSCYKFHGIGLVWYKAYMTCMAEGGHLVIVDSEQEMNVVREIFAKHPDKDIFTTHKLTMAIGVHDWGERVSFRTIRGKPVPNPVINWAEKQPSNTTNSRTLDEGEFCGAVGRDGLLDDIACGLAVPFLCEKKPNSLLQNN